MSEDEIIKIVAYVGISKVRSNILKFIGEDLRYPSQIAKELDIRIQHVSTALKELKGKELVECINEDVKVGRLYRTTNKGKQVIKLIK
ncbi:MAG: transcriptional regulator [Methanobrevibacter sp.]|jgi:predicted transcriptional regulator|nr:transcriptional regulator [Candidatus Methanoflexus mossambicus]